MVQSNRTSDVFAVADAWRSILGKRGVMSAAPSTTPLRPPATTSLSTLVPHYRLDGPAVVRRDLARHPAMRRFDDAPVFIMVPQWRYAERFVNAATFVDAAQRAMALRNRAIPRVYGCGLLADGRPYAVVSRGAGDSLDRASVRSGGLPWSVTRAIALRMCAAIHTARAAGLAPRSNDLDACSVILDEDGALVEVWFDDVFVDSSARLEDADVRAVAMAIHSMLGQRPRAPAIDNLVLRALGTLRFATLRALMIAITSIDDDGVVGSHCADYAAYRGEFNYDHETDGNDDERAAIQLAHSSGESARSRAGARASATADRV